MKILLSLLIFATAAFAQPQPEQKVVFATARIRGYNEFNRIASLNQELTTYRVDSVSASGRDSGHCNVVFVLSLKKTPIEQEVYFLTVDVPGYNQISENVAIQAKLAAGWKIALIDHAGTGGTQYSNAVVVFER